MRISTSQIFDAGTLGIQNGQSGLYKLQNQLSTGRRVLTPQDDPVAAAQALVVTQTRGVNQQHMDNQGQAKSQLGLVDSQLSSLVNVLQVVRERVVQAGNTGTLSQSDRAAIATELQSRLSEIVGIANSDNGVGEYLFSGYKGNVRPFAVDGSALVVPPATTKPVAYFGDDGERLLQVSSSRQMAVSAAGSDVFMNVKQGNGTFVTGTGGNTAGGINQGAASVDAGSVQDPQKWQAAINSFGWVAPTNPALQVRFSVAAGVTSYQLYDVSGAPVAISSSTPYVSGQAISMASTNPPAATVTDFGSQMIVQGQPANNDTFTIMPSTKQSLFQTMQNLIGILTSPIGSSTYTSTQFSNDLSAELTNLDQSFANIARVQVQVGTKLQEIDSLGSASSDLDIQYQATLSGLQDLDYAKAISDFMSQQMNLEAAQKSFAQVSGLSLFNYL